MDITKLFNFNQLYREVQVDVPAAVFLMRYNDLYNIILVYIYKNIYIIDNIYNYYK